MPYFVVPGTGVRNEIPSMPGNFRTSIDELVKDCKASFDLGVHGVILFGIPESKDAEGSGAWADDGIVQQALRVVKEACPELCLIGDVCLCEYTSHGHCGLLRDGEILNDETVELLVKEAISHAKAGADICTVHIETLDAPESTFSRIRELGMKPGLSLNPDTKIQRVLPYLDSVDQILIMSVFPGFSGQAFISAVLEKVRVIARESAGSRLEIEIDGGTNNATAPLAVAAGASILVAATAIFRAKDIPSACRELREAAQREAKGFSR